MIHYFFFFNDTATTEIYTLSLHDALPISSQTPESTYQALEQYGRDLTTAARSGKLRSEEHTSELQSRQYLVCRLLLEKKKTKIYSIIMVETLKYIKPNSITPHSPDQ